MSVISPYFSHIHYSSEQMIVKNNSDNFNKIIMNIGLGIDAG